MSALSQVAAELAEAHAFQRALELWSAAARIYADAREACRLAHARAYLASAGTDSVRKANADVETSVLRLMRDKCEVEERAAYYHMASTAAFLGLKLGERSERSGPCS